MKFLKQVKAEMTKVVWPPRDKTLFYTIIVIVVSQANVTAETCKLMDGDVTGDPQLDVIVNVIVNAPRLVVSKLSYLHAVDVSPVPIHPG